MTIPLIITRTDLDDVDGSRYCAPRSRVWFYRMGLDWRDFVFNGIDAEILIATGDAMAIKLVEEVRARNGR